jgi:hypothetical protein
MGGMKLDRRSLLAAGPLLMAAMAAGDKTAKLDNIKLARHLKSARIQAKRSSSPTRTSLSSHGAICHRTAARWPSCMEISTARVRIWF